MTKAQLYSEFDALDIEKETFINFLVEWFNPDDLEEFLVFVKLELS